ncbi:S8 family serine peptidase [Cellvibrio mixtus]|uniref:S8 family serine peptidase n=1 Tax=Cellvibrio mixtus TaxID=39650 RepID=UPI000693B018|nr:S8 family serine peptidase [Cellvibrio mixtus]
MKPPYLYCLLLACLCHSANAQLLDRLGNQVDGVTREQEQVTGDVQEQVRRAAEDELSTRRLLDNTLDHPVINPLTDVLTQTTEEVTRTTTEITRAANNIVGNAMAAVLPILNRDGRTAFVEVQVEDNWRAVEREWLILLDQSGLKALAALDAEIIEQTQFAELGMQLVRFRVPATLDSSAALKKYLPPHLHEQLDRNHIYNPQKDISRKDIPHTPSQAAFCNHAVRVGMIDTAINLQHPAFAQRDIDIKDFAGEEFDAPRAHGTAVAGVLVGRGEQLTPLLPAAHLFAASVFYPRSEYAQGATMVNLVRALNWLLEKNVQVINMSLAGPENKILALAIQKTIQTGTVIVAAAGNEGPAAPPAYPAAYTDVIAVTAVDKNQRIYRWANRGDYIDFAALGVAVFTARSSGDFGNETGTSMAAPLVTAAAACIVATANASAINPSLINFSTIIGEQLKKNALDLGVAGRDPVFGDGLLNRP